jgi:signal transduction histidine kinase
MAIWGRLRDELDRAGRMAQGAIDEGRVRLELFRARQRADRAAQALGYAIHRARRDTRELAPGEIDELAAAIAAAEAEVERLQTQLAAARRGAATQSVDVTPPPTP